MRLMSLCLYRTRSCSRRGTLQRRLVLFLEVWQPPTCTSLSLIKSSLHLSKIEFEMRTRGSKCLFCAKLLLKTKRGAKTHLMWQDSKNKIQMTKSKMASKAVPHTKRKQWNAQRKHDKAVTIEHGMSTQSFRERWLLMKILVSCQQLVCGCACGHDSARHCENGG